MEKRLEARPSLGTLSRVIIAWVMSGQKVQLAYVGLVESDVGESDRYRWKNGNDIFQVNTKQMRCMLSGGAWEEHSSLRKWQNEIPEVLAEKELWGTIRKSYREPKINIFLWQIVYWWFYLLSIMSSPKRWTLGLIGMR